MRAIFAAPHFGMLRIRRSAACNSVSPFPEGLILVEPAQWIFVVVEFHRRFGQLEGMLGVEHDRELFGASRVLACHDRSLMGAVGNSARMQRDRSRFDSLPRTEIAPDVE